jgi:hypothetical protein
MNSKTTLLRVSFAFILFLATTAIMGPAAIAKNHCKDRCNDNYHLRKDFCRSIPLKHERHTCEDAAKHAKDNCKHHCG